MLPIHNICFDDNSPFNNGRRADRVLLKQSEISGIPVHHKHRQCKRPALSRSVSHLFLGSVNIFFGDLV